METLTSEIMCKNELIQLAIRLNSLDRFYKFKTKQASYLYDIHTQNLNRFDGKDSVVLWAEEPEMLEGIDCITMHERLSAICNVPPKKNDLYS